MITRMIKTPLITACMLAGLSGISFQSIAAPGLLTAAAVSQSAAIPKAALAIPHKRWQQSTMNLRQMRASVEKFHQSKGKVLLPLGLFDNEQVQLSIDQANFSNKKKHSFTGAIEGVKNSRGVFLMKGDKVFGNVYMGAKAYQIRPDDKGGHVLIEIDTSAFKELEQHDDATEAPRDTAADSQGDNASADITSNIITSTAINTSLYLPFPDMTTAANPFINVMVLYTDDVADTYTNVEEEVELAVLDANSSYVASGIKQRLALSYTGEVSYAESGNITTDRNRLRGKTDGYMDQIHALRDKYKADLVSLFTKNGGGYCGMAYIQSSVTPSQESYGFNVTKYTCAVGNHSFAHEMGHNMGARHDRYVDNTDGSPYNYNHGYTNSAEGWRTIMAYNNACEAAGTSCTRLGKWSSPSVYEDGSPTGIANNADNVRTLNNTAYNTSRFRTQGLNEDGDYFGARFAAGDFNNDGYNDLAVSAYLESVGSNKSGYVFVYKGTPYGLAPWFGLDQAGLGGNENYDYFGFSLASGDFNHDGFDDLAIGAPYEDLGSTSNAGAVFVYKGDKNGLSPWRSLTQTGLGTNEANDLFGYALASADFNHDGYSDLAVGAPGENTYAGYVYVFHGSTSGPLANKSLAQYGSSGENYDYFGYSLAAGDFDNDGYMDLASGAPYEDWGSINNAGMVSLYRGSASGLNNWGYRTQDGLDSNEASDYFGYALAAGDLNGDGMDDLAISAPYEQIGTGARAGAVYLYSGSTSGPQSWASVDQSDIGAANEASDWFGRSLAIANFNHDGYADLVVAAPYEDLGSTVNAGAAFVFRGSSSGVTGYQTLTQDGLGANEASDYLSYGMIAADFNADGFADLILGAPGEAPGSDPEGGFAFAFKGTYFNLSPWQGIGQEM